MNGRTGVHLPKEEACGKWSRSVRLSGGVPPGLTGSEVQICLERERQGPRSLPCCPILDRRQAAGCRALRNASRCATKPQVKHEHCAVQCGRRGLQMGTTDCPVVPSTRPVSIPIHGVCSAAIDTLPEQRAHSPDGPHRRSTGGLLEAWRSGTAYKWQATCGRLRAWPWLQTIPDARTSTVHKYLPGQNG